MSTNSRPICQLHKTVQPALTPLEMLAGADSRTERQKVTLKQLGILRKYVYDCIHSGQMPRWENVLECIDKAYVIEYAFGDANVHGIKVMTEWET
jgi:hypothetical protein